LPIAVGDCENKTLWTPINAGVLTDYATDKLYGTQSIRITHGANNAAGMMYLVQSLIDISKYYLVSAWLKTDGVATSGVNVQLLDNGYVFIAGNAAIKPTAWTRIGIKVRPSDFSGKNLTAIRLIFNDLDTNRLSNSYIDGVMLNEISSIDYNLTIPQLFTKYAYKV
jgi:hypothetical protein